ncbi:MAG: PKD domain-containing protein [Deltaproteobacteria bacterium]|nr:PKD domain-containing protein [Deltaproteobacteria bacterium]
MRVRGITSLAAVLVTLLGCHDAASAAQYVVATNGNDRNPGTADRPFATLQQAANVVVAGDVVTIRPGEYRQRAEIGAAGRMGAPIAFNAQAGAHFETPSSVVVNEAIGLLSTAAYLRFVGFELGSGFSEGILVRDGAHDIEIRDCRAQGDHVGVAIGSAVRVTVAGCSLHNHRRAGLRIGGAASDITVQDTVSFNNDDGLGCAGESDGFVIDGREVHNVSFLRTRAYGNGEDGYDLYGSDLVLDQVESHGGCSGMKLRDTASVSNCLITDARTGIETTALSRDTHFSVLNCTLINDLFPIIFDAPTRPIRAYAAELFNSIVVAPNRALDYDYRVTLSEGHNIFWRGDQTQALIRVLPEQGEFSGHDINDGQYRQLTGRGDATLSLDPLLVDPDNGNFAPQALSAAVDRGDAAHMPLNDLNGTSRPRGSGPDIGAIETLGSATNHPPQAAMNVRTDLFGRVNRPTYFDASDSFDPDGDALTFSWNFGDGSPVGSQAHVSHLYRSVGIYTVILTVSDGRLSSRLETTIQIGSLPTPPATLPHPSATMAPPVATATPTVLPASATPTLTPTSLPSSVALNLVGSAVGVRGRLVSFTLRYRGLFVPASIRITLPAGIIFQSAAPGVLRVSGNELFWDSPTSNLGALKLSALVDRSVAPGSALVTSATLVETNSGRSVSQSATTVVQ